ncbi:MAG: hypothetical protein J5864_06505, partial [Oscillospiraceae bacterium]|nr:hypothetical protein [Oscillospiraceae bacterium]
ILKLKKTASRSKITYNRTYPVYEKLKKAAFSEGGLILTEDKGSGNDISLRFLKHQQKVHRCSTASPDLQKRISAMKM